jgi:hypothetical protein
MLHIENYFALHNKKTVRRTRSVASKLINQHEMKIESYIDGEILIKMNEKIMTIFIDEAEVKSIVCYALCEHLCDHKEAVLYYLSSIDAKATKTEKRKRESTSENENEDHAKKIKTNDENNSLVANKVGFDKTEIKISKKKKKVELTEEQMTQIETISSLLSMENLIKHFGRGNYREFYNFCKEKLAQHEDVIQLANKLTEEQADTDLWHLLRIGRVTASRLYETTRCTVKNGSLMEKYLGKSSGFSFFMYRGTVLEEYVFNEIKKEYPTLQKCGLIMNHKINPFFAASPDGLHEDFVLEIKCPGTKNTFEQYTNLNKLNKKYFAQIQLQMYVTEKKHALLAVASLDFEVTRNITKLWIDFDAEYVNEMIEHASEYYEDAIFPALKRKFLK